MSTTVIAYTIIGSKVDRDDFFVHKERSVHENCGRTGPGPYCMKCGQSLGMMKAEVVPIDGFEEEGGEDGWGLIGGLSIISVSDNHFLAVRISECGEPWRNDIGEPSKMGAAELMAELPGMRDKVKAVLNPLGLWKPANFGIWTALYYSS